MAQPTPFEFQRAGLSQGSSNSAFVNLSLNKRTESSSSQGNIRFLTACAISFEFFFNEVSSSARSSHLSSRFANSNIFKRRRSLKSLIKLSRRCEKLPPKIRRRLAEPLFRLRPLVLIKRRAYAKRIASVPARYGILKNRVISAANAELGRRQDVALVRRRLNRFKLMAGRRFPYLSGARLFARLERSGPTPLQPDITIVSS